MKTILILFLLLSLGLNANSDNKKNVYMPSQAAKKTEYAPIVKVKYSLSLSKKYSASPINIIRIVFIHRGMNNKEIRRKLIFIFSLKNIQ